jgi:hypothetical protein
LIANATAGVTLLLVVVSGFGLLAVLPPLFLLASSVGFIIPNAIALALSRRPDAAGTGSALLGVIQSGVAAFGAHCGHRRDRHFAADGRRDRGLRPGRHHCLCSYLQPGAVGRRPGPHHRVLAKAANAAETAR